MPYIKQSKRLALDLGKVARVSGELNYTITMIIQAYLDDHGKSYSTMSEIVSALELSKDEFQRRVVHPYEDEKIKENGDVYYV